MVRSDYIFVVCLFIFWKLKKLHFRAISHLFVLKSQSNYHNFPLNSNCIYIKLYTTHFPEVSHVSSKVRLIFCESIFDIIWRLQRGVNIRGYLNSPLSRKYTLALHATSWNSWRKYGTSRFKGLSPIVRYYGRQVGGEGNSFSLTATWMLLFICI